MGSNKKGNEAFEHTKKHSEKAKKMYVSKTQFPPHVTSHSVSDYYSWSLWEDRKIQTLSKQVQQSSSVLVTAIRWGKVQHTTQQQLLAAAYTLQQKESTSGFTSLTIKTLHS